MEAIMTIIMIAIIFIFSCEISGLGPEHRQKKKAREREERNEQLFKQYYDEYKKLSDKRVNELNIECVRECRAIMSAPIGKGMYDNYEMQCTVAKQKAITAVINERNMKKNKEEN